MTTQIAVRLPDPLVEALDAIAAGTATRSEIVRLALEQFVQVVAGAVHIVQGLRGKAH